jgi:hypothetical protein
MNGLILALALAVNARSQRRGQERDSVDDLQDCRHADGHRTILRQIGHLRAACLEALQTPREGNGPRTGLDLDEVTLVDVGAVRFLGACEAAGITILHRATGTSLTLRGNQAPGHAMGGTYHDAYTTLHAGSLCPSGR